MSLVFNPTTGTLQRTSTNTGGGNVIFDRREVVVDAAFLITPDVDLGITPITNSEVVFLNGLQIGSACYSITGNILSWIDSSELREGDTIFIRYNG